MKEEIAVLFWPVLCQHCPWAHHYIEWCYPCHLHSAQHLQLLVSPPNPELSTSLQKYAALTSWCLWY